MISYGAEADGVVTTARRADDAAASDQVLCVFLKEDYTLERLGGWETLGMRGTCSIGFRLLANAPAGSVMKARYADIHSQTMTPVSTSCGRAPGQASPRAPSLKPRPSPAP